MWTLDGLTSSMGSWTSGGPYVGAFPGRAIPRARVPFRPDDNSQDGGMNVCIG